MNVNQRISESANQRINRSTIPPLWPLALVILIYVALAVAYSIVTPIGRGADEWAHYWYAGFIAEHHRLPASPAEREAAGYKSDWPPLYHLAAAALTGWVDTAGPPTFKYRADNVRRQLIPARGPEAIVHTEDELFPWQQEILVWHLGRFLSIAFSAGTLLVTYFIGLELFRDLRFTIYDLRLSPNILALISTAVVAFTPRFLFTGMLFNYDSLTLLLASLFLWLAIRVASGRHPRGGFWGLGALAGLALVTKYLAALLPVLILLVAWARGAGAQGCTPLRYASGAVGGARAQERAEPHYSLFAIHYSLFTIRSLVQAAIGYIITTGWWFAYLIINFNQIDAYGPVLGTLAPLIRGDGSDRTLEQLFAWFSGGQAPPPAYIEKQTYTAWQIITQFPLTFWGNPITRPYPLTWFVIAMTGITVLAFIGLIFQLRATSDELRISAFLFVTRHSSLVILLLTCLLPMPFMLIRLFGARDALEAVQGRHILFLAGPAFAVLLVWGLAFVARRSSFVTRITFYTLFALLLTGAISQLFFMMTAYAPPAPVRTTDFSSASPLTFTLPGGASLLDYRLGRQGQALQVELIWRGGDDFAPEDYRLELQLVGDRGPVSGWSGYQTQARYPTRAWESDDIVRDTGWLPLVNLPAGEYVVQMRLLGQTGPLMDWQTLAEWRLSSDERRAASDEWTVWRDGQPVKHQPEFGERETAQLTNYELRTIVPEAGWSGITNYELTGPDGAVYPSAAAGDGWANFIIEPHWPAGDYTLPGIDGPALRVTPSTRNFALPPEMAQPVQANFAGQATLLGYTLPARRMEPGDGLPVTLYWRAEQWLGEDFVIFDRLLDNQGVARGGYDRRPQENYSTLLWAPGEIITDGFAVPVDSDAPPGVYWLNVGLYRRVAGQAESLPLVEPETGDPLGETAVRIGPVKVGGPPPGVTVQNPQPQMVINQTFGDEITLFGYDIRKSEIENLKLVFFWQALRQPESDYTVFLHLRNTAGETVAQKDQPPTGGVYPTSLWDAGEIIADELVLPVENLPPGEYTPVVGLYSFATGQRLTVPGIPANEVELPPVRIGE